MKFIKTLVLVASLFIAGVMGALAYNQEQVALNFAIWQTGTASLFWWLLAAFLLGLAFGIINNVWVGLGKRLENRRLRQSLAQAEAELARLRDVTIQG